MAASKIYLVPADFSKGSDSTLDQAVKMAKGNRLERMGIMSQRAPGGCAAFLCDP